MPHLFENLNNAFFKASHNKYAYVSCLFQNIYPTSAKYILCTESLITAWMVELKLQMYF